MDYIKKLFKEHREVIAYLFFGGVTTLVNMGVFFFMRTFLPMVNENIANAVAIIITVIVAYITNRKYVFCSREKNVLKESLSFFGGRAFTMIMELTGFYLFASVIGFNEFVVKISMIIIVVITNYFISKLIVFRKKSTNSEDEKQK